MTSNILVYATASYFLIALTIRWLSGKAMDEPIDQIMSGVIALIAAIPSCFIVGYALSISPYHFCTSYFRSRESDIVYSYRFFEREGASTELIRNAQTSECLSDPYSYFGGSINSVILSVGWLALIILSLILAYSILATFFSMSRGADGTVGGQSFRQNDNISISEALEKIEQLLNSRIYRDSRGWMDDLTLQKDRLNECTTEQLEKLMILYSQFIEDLPNCYTDAEIDKGMLDRKVKATKNKMEQVSKKLVKSRSI